MTKEHLSEIIDAVFNRVKHINNTKGADYAPGKDALGNFKKVAEDTGISKYQVWSIYAGKHMDAIRAAIKNAPPGQRPSRKGEPLEESINDTVLYSILLLALMIEDSQEVGNG